MTRGGESNGMLEAALDYVARGLAPIPVPHRQKGPLIDNWQDLRITAETAPAYFNGTKQNLGVILGKASGGLTDIDLDCPEAIAAAPYILPRAAVFGRASKLASHWEYRTNLCETQDRAVIKFMGSDKTGLLELRMGANGLAAQTIFPPSTHVSGEPIEWAGRGASEIAVVEGDDLIQCARRLAAAAELARQYPKVGGRHDAAFVLGGFLARCSFSPAKAAVFVEAVGAASLQPGDKRRDMARTARDGAHTGKRAGFPALAETFGKDTAKKVADWLEYEGDQDKAPQAADGAEEPERAPAFSDEALALQFAERHANGLRYVAAWGKWLSWTGTHWRLDDTLHAFDLARQIAREAASKCNKPKIASVIASAKTVASIERLAKSDRRLAATVDQWDADPWLLNTPLGVVDLRTGRLRPHRSDDYMTKITAVGPGDDCPKFKVFLKRIMNSDDALVAFLCRMFGYCLTGDTSEQAIFFNYGKGQNGKSVLMSTVSGILGDYCVSTPIETFTESKIDRHPTEIARLRGARLVTATETEAGRYWAESRLKELTGGEKTSARFMHQNLFEFVPAFKPVISGNHRPRLRSVGVAMRRRVNMIPFAVTIPEDERDKQFANKLKEEWPGVLQLMIDGCLDWNEHGLAPPEAVTRTTDEYFAGEDGYSDWIADRCETIAGFLALSEIG